MSGRTTARVAVLMGGPSSECEVSRVSGRACSDALAREGFDAVATESGRDLPARLEEIAPDVAFNALHGRWGEDGCVQGLLEWLGIPYTHSGVLASALAMDKARSKETYRAAGLPVLESTILPTAEAAARHAMAPPYVIKPNDEGSSVGIYIVPEGANAPPALADTMPDRVMVERYAPGRELTVTVLDGRALGVTDILTDGWYDYEAKYAPGGSRHVLPAEVPGNIAKACADFARRAHAALGCRGLSRTDFRYTEGQGQAGLFLLETNTQPGMTPTSLTPEQAEHAGIGFDGLCRALVEDASCRR